MTSNRYHNVELKFLCYDAADIAGVQAHLIEAEERLRAGERSSGIDGFSQSPAFVSETFCTFAAGNV